MNSDKDDERDVPAGWELCVSKKNSSRKYYFNRKTGESSWTKPQDFKSPNGNRTKKSKEDNKPKIPIPSKEEIRKILKRKSDGSSSSSASKKPEGIPTPEKQNVSKTSVKKRSSTGSIKESPKFNSKRPKTEEKALGPLKKSPRASPSPSKRKQFGNTSRDSDQSPVATPKNTANARLSQLRAELTADAKNEEASETPRTNNQTPKPSTQTPKTNPQTPKTNAQTPKPNIQTPKTPQSDKKENEAQSLSPDTAQSALSPSQFFTANKIIYSMKAQLPDRDSARPKDAFADIEEGINNQTTEYPFMKHPATPPQFSEASKLMSAINSKLCYRKVPDPPIFLPESPSTQTAPTSVYNVFKSNTPANTFKAETPGMTRTDTSISSYRSAKDRLEDLRKRLSSDNMDTQAHISQGTEIIPTEAMDVDVREMKQTVPEPRNVPEVRNTPVINKEKVFLVVDTNIFIHELDFIKNIMNSHIEGYKEQPTLLVPWRVINELDKLKDSNNGNGAICKRARPAMDYLYKSLPDNNRIKVQPLRDANSHIYPCESPDDEILNCCLQQSERGNSVILLSNDKNLCSKAVANGVETRRLRALVLKAGPHSNATPLCGDRLKRHIFTLLSNILENEMRAKYDNLWLHVVLKPPPWNLSDVLQSLLKHWIAVFNEVFPRIEYLIMDLNNSLGVIDRKAKNKLTQSELCNFKELCLEVAKRCQIIPEYMQLAKTTVDKLEKDSECTDTEKERDGNTESEGREREGETPVIDAFESVWDVYSSYCAKLSSSLGIEHTLEDKFPGDESLPGLTDKLTMFGNQIAAIAASMDGVLNAATNSPMFIEQVSRLEAAFKESLTELRIDGVVSNNSIRMFCTKCRNMLQEAHGKFYGLVQLLTVCRNTLGN